MGELIRRFKPDVFGSQLQVRAMLAQCATNPSGVRAMRARFPVYNWPDRPSRDIHDPNRNPGGIHTERCRCIRCGARLQRYGGACSN